LRDEERGGKEDELVKLSFPSGSAPSPVEEDKRALIVDGEGD